MTRHAIRAVCGKICWCATCKAMAACDDWEGHAADEHSHEEPKP